MDLKGIYWRSDDQTLRVVKTNKEVGVSRIVGDLYVVVTELQKDAFLFGTHVASASVAVSQPIELLHNRLGHLNVQDIRKLIHVATGIEIRNQYMPDVCDGCAQGKHTIDINHQAASRAVLAYDLVHLDLLGPITPTGYDGTKYAAFLTDDQSRCQWKFNLKVKGALGKVLQEFHQMIKTQTGHTVKRYRLDNDPAITSNHMRQWAKTHGVHFEFTAPYSPNEDGVAERGMRTNIEKLRSMMAGCYLPKKLWPLGLSTTVYLKNRSPTKAIKEGATPIQKLTNTVPDLSHLRVWGCTAYLRLPEETLVKSEKFYPISKKHSFVGYEGHLWLLWDGHKVIRSKNVIFDESR